MDSTLWYAISTSVMTLLFLLSLLLILRHSAKAQKEAAQQINLVVAATLKTGLAQTEQAATLITQMSEDQRAQLAALMNATRESVKDQLTTAVHAADQVVHAAEQQAALQEQAASRYEKLAQAPLASLTSLLTIVTRLLGTKDPLAYQAVARAEQPADTTEGPYTTGDELEQDRRQQAVDEMFNQWNTGDVSDGGSDERSDLADFGVTGV